MSLFFSLLLFSTVDLSFCSSQQSLDAVPNSLWPLPASVTASGTPLPISPVFTIHTSSSSGVVKRGITRYLEIILRQIGGNKAKYPSEGSETLDELVLNVRSDDESLRVDTSYWYILKIGDGQANIEAKTPYGAL